MNTAFYLDDLIQRYPVLSPVKEDIRRFYEMLKDTFESGGKLLVAGNGGSCADAEHIVGELAKGFCKTCRRPGTGTSGPGASQPSGAYHRFSQRCQR